MKNSKPATPLLICFGVVTLLLTILVFPVGIIVGLFLGYVLTYIVDLIMRNRNESKTSGKFDGSIDADELVKFLDEHLRYLYPYFHEWEYEKNPSPPENKPLWDVKFRSSFGRNKKGFAIIYIGYADVYNPMHGQKYRFNADANIPTGTGCCTKDQGRV